MGKFAKISPLADHSPYFNTLGAHAALRRIRKASRRPPRM
jgi:hypothetical protein